MENNGQMKNLKFPQLYGRFSNGYIIPNLLEIKLLNKNYCIDTTGCFLNGFSKTLITSSLLDRFNQFGLQLFPMSKDFIF